MRRLLMTLSLLLLSPGLAQAKPDGGAEIADATGRVVQVPAQMAHVLPAGAPAAVLLAALAPDLMLGWPMPLSADKRAWLAPQLAALPAVPNLSARGENDAAVTALRPDLIVDYGTVSPGYIAAARTMQERTGIPTVLLDGALADMPRVLRLLGHSLRREPRGEQLAQLAEDLLHVTPQSGPARRVMYLRGTDTLSAASPDSGAVGVFARLGWEVVAPPGSGRFHPATLRDVAALDPDVLVFAEPAMRAIVAASPEWRALRAVREGHAVAAPRLPFGWIEEPPSLNQLLGVAWLAGRDPATLAATFGAVVYGQPPTPDELARIGAITQPFPP
jgi:iron complex transport system substrate-binding protein